MKKISLVLAAAIVGLASMSMANADTTTATSATQAADAIAKSQNASVPNLKGAKSNIQAKSKTPPSTTESGSQAQAQASKAS